MSDIGIDLNMKPAMFSSHDPDGEGERIGWFRALFRRAKEPAVHAGFLTAWRSVQDAVWDCVYAPEFKDWKTTFVGHSLGGALATLAAASAAEHGCENSTSSRRMTHGGV